MQRVTFSVLRGVCQIPAYVSYEKGFFREEGIEVYLSVEPTAWMVPHKFRTGEVQFAVIPWTRVAISKDPKLVLICGSGFEEAAMVIREGIAPQEVKRVSVPQRGGMKDLTAMSLIEKLGWQDAELIRMPSGDGAIISLFGKGADAASMVEPFATLMESMGVGNVVKRTGDVWDGAPGCSLTTTSEIVEKEPELVQGVVNAFLRGVYFTHQDPEEASQISSRYIGINAEFIRKALDVNRPDADAIRNKEAMEEILSLMKRLGYVDEIPKDFIKLSFLDKARQENETGQD